MAEQERKFSFISLGMPGDTFGVVRFKGMEGLSTIYSFEVELISKNHDLDLNEVIQNPARFTILRKEKDIAFNGILINFEQLHKADEYSFYKATLVPKFWWLSQTTHNQVFLDMTVPQILGEVLKDGGLNSDTDFELRLQKDYRPWEYVCQYGETHLSFVKRWMEREGIYYFFEQTSHGEKLIITDTILSHSFMSEGRKMIYSPPSGLDSQSREEVVKNFSCRQKMLPKSLRLKDYNYKKPSLTMEAVSDVSDEGRGEVYIYGENFETPEEGKSLAKIRSEELMCRERTYHGESTIPYMRPGYRFELLDHYRDNFNRTYLNIEVYHEGNQSSFLLAGLSKDQLSEKEKSQYYINNFTAIEGEVQFRPKRDTKKPKFFGTLNARIDAASSGEYAELDETGRYKVILPFDRSGRHGGKASAWVRMMQPYAGPNQGMHFPLHRGTEVLLTFIDGDPDRPIIAGAVPNPETASPVNSLNQTKSIIKTGRSNPQSTIGAAAWQTDVFNYLSDNFIEIEDKQGEECIRIHSPKDIWVESERYVSYDTGGPTARNDVPEKVRYLWDKFYGASPGFNPGGMAQYDYGSESQPVSSSDLTTIKNLAKKGKVEIAKGDSFNTQEGNIYDFGGYWNYNLGNSYEENFMAQDSTAVLNSSSLPYDKANTGGPYYSSIGDLGGHGGNIWVTKNIKGASYEYSTEVDSVEVNHHCDSYEYKYGGRTEEYKYTGDGVMTYEMQSSGGETFEKKYTRTEQGSSGHGTKVLDAWSKGIDSTESKYDKESGNLISYTSSSNSGGSKSEFEFVRCAKATASISLGAAASFSLSADAKASLSIAFSAALSIDIAFTASIDLKTGLGIGLDLDLRAGGSFVLKPSGGLKFDGMGFTARKKALVEAKKAELEAEAVNLRMDCLEMKISKNSAKIQKNFAFIGDIAIDFRKSQGVIIL